MSSLRVLLVLRLDQWHRGDGLLFDDLEEHFNGARELETT